MPENPRYNWPPNVGQGQVFGLTNSTDWHVLPNPDMPETSSTLDPAETTSWSAELRTEDTGDGGFQRDFSCIPETMASVDTEKLRGSVTSHCQSTRLQQTARLDAAEALGNLRSSGADGFQRDFNCIPERMASADTEKLRGSFTSHGQSTRLQQHSRHDSRDSHRAIQRTQLQAAVNMAGESLIPAATQGRR